MQSSGGASCACNCGMVWSIVEIVCGVATALSGVLTVIGGSGGDHIPAALVGVALIAAGVTIMLYAIGVLVNGFVQEWMKFYTTFLGRGITFLLLGIIGWRGFSTFFLILSIVEVVLGILYIILQFIPGVPPATPICGGGGAVASK